MSESLEFLVDKQIDRAEIIHDYLQLFFVDGTILNILNFYSIDGALDPRLAGYELAVVQQNEKEVTLSLLPEGTIRVGLKNSDYRGPEAMEYIRKDGPCIVWP